MITLRSSSLHRYEACPASFHLAKLAPELPESDDATSGTRIHAALAGSLEFDALTCDEQQTFEMMTEAYDGIVSGLPDPVRYVEQDFELSHPLGTVTGHPDLVEIRGEHCIVVDWKAGRNDVERAENNIQLLAYCLMVAARHPEPQTFQLAIIQPWVRGGGSSAFLTRSELAGAWHRITRIFERIIAAEEDPQPSLEACRYCPAAPVCPVQRMQLATVSKADLSAQRWEVATPSEKLALYDLCSQVQKVAGVIQSLIKSELTANPGYYGGELFLKPGATKATITDPAGLYLSLSKYITPEEFLPCVTVAKTKLKPIVKAKTGGKGKAFDDEFEAMLAPFVSEKQNEPSVERKKAE